PFIDYYDQQSHRIVLYGDFTNNGTVRFTNQSYPVYNAFPTSGIATVYFMGASSNTLTCNNTTDFYNLVLDKGVDQSFSLTVYSSDYDHFRLFGANTSAGDGGGANPNLKKALWIRTGSLVLQGLTIIPSLTEGGGTGTPNSDFYIPANGALILDGPDVVVLSTADDYREVNIAYGVSGGSGSVNGVNKGTTDCSFSIYGKLQINEGYLSTRESSGFVTWDIASGEFIINGGVVDAKQFRADGGSSGLSSFTQTGGTFYLRGRLQRTPTQYVNVSDFTDFSGATLGLPRLTSGIDANMGSFNVNAAANVFAMSGGTIEIFDVCGTPGYAIDIFSDPGNINVSGGTIKLSPYTGNGINYDFIVRSRAEFGNLTVSRVSSTSSIVLNTYALTVLNDVNLTSGDLDANNLNLSIGGDFNISSGTSYTTGTNKTVFNGSDEQTLNCDLASALSLNKLEIDKSAGDALVFDGSQSTFNIADSLIILEGEFNDNGKTINVSGHIYNTGSHTGAGSIVLNGTSVQEIGGDDTGIFENIELNNTNAASAPVSLSSDVTINGALTLSQDKLFNIATNNLALGASASIVNAGSNRFIQTAGNAGDGGVTKTYSASSDSFTFPLGTSSTRHASIDYTPATISFASAPTTFGSITVLPVGYEHPNTTNNNRSLSYFWRVKSNGFTLGSASINHSYTYSTNDVVDNGTDITENGYIAAMYDPSSYSWTKYATTDVDETSNLIGGTGTALATLNYIEGEFTAGDDTPAGSDPFGSPTIYYSRANGNWNNTNTWSNASHTGGAAGSTPTANDIVIIGNNNTVSLTQNENCASLQINSGAVLDIDLYTGSTFTRVLSSSGGNGLFRLKTVDAGFGARIQLFTFPSGDFSDFNVNEGTTEFYTTTSSGSNVYILPANVTSYGNLILSPNGLDNLSLPNNSYTNIYGDFTLNSVHYHSWTTMSWNTTNWGSGAFNPTIEKTVHVHGDFYVNGGSFAFMDDYQPQHLIVEGNIEINASNGANIFVLDPAVRGTWVGGAAQDNTLTVGGDIINNCNTGVWYHAGLFLNSGGYYCDVTFNGSGTNYLTNTAGNPGIRFRNVTIDKGSSQADSLIVDIGGYMITPTDNWLTLTNGTFHYEHNDDLTISTATPFTIPSTAGLSINSNGNDVYLANSNSDANDVYLNGKLSVIAGDVIVGNSGNNRNNDIEYSGGGDSEIEIQGGSLTVNGQIRRNPSTTAGVLKYMQAGGALTVNGRNTNTTNAKFEVLNTGSSFNMSAGTINIVRGGGGSTYGDLYLRAETSSVTGGEIIFSQ
ncbi:MAG: hypothetical protein MI922_20120, partial [Bacteroidales bacterium]|nr:hypothetical protein [Bacteroidales bacterium]